MRKKAYRTLFLLSFLLSLPFAIFSQELHNLKIIDEQERSKLGTEISIIENHYYARKVLKLLRSAKKTIRLAMPRVDYSGNPSHIVTQLVEVLVSQARRGVDVEVLVEKEGLEGEKKNQELWNLLYEEGIKIYNDSPQVEMVTNAIIVDGFTAVLSTVVWTEHSVSDVGNITYWVESLSFCEDLLERLNKVKAAGMSTNVKY